MSSGRDTIVALATPTGRGGVAIVRISGPMAPVIGTELMGGLPAPRYAATAKWRDAQGGIIDMGLAIHFPAPHSFTGEDVLELHGHGGEVVVDALIERVVELGARRARAGEFSERAFLNEKIDLAQAEAIADLIDAGSRRGAQAAMRSLQGEFSARVNQVRGALTALRIYVEAAIDFPEEEIDFLASQEVRERLDDVQQGMAQVLHSAEQGALLTRATTIAIAGRPNAGKSTLMNALAGHDVAIVTPIAGTTRDLLRERVRIDGAVIELVDTAGLRDVDASASQAGIEAEGIRRARDAIAKADHLLFVVDANTDPQAQSLAEEREASPGAIGTTLVFNKCDLAPHVMQQLRQDAHGLLSRTGVSAVFAISATNSEGLPALRAHLAALTGHAEENAGAFSARARHVDALRRARAHLDAAAAQLAAKQGDLAAFELRESQRELGEVVGDVTSDELLGRIFSSFCIGK